MNYSRIKGRILLFLVLLSAQGMAQNLPNVIPPSPQTTELNKYIDFPVNLSTGVPEISIPLYTIKTKGIEIPITLNYHASGIKHGQSDGDVGVGWSLSCNYRVSRTIYGHADAGNIEMSPTYYQSQIQYYDNNLPFPFLISGSVTINDRHLLYPYMNRDKFFRRFIANYVEDLQSPSTSEPLLDGEYDHFNYSIANGGGKFIISNRAYKTISEINPTNNKFNYLEGTASNNAASGIIGFSIKDVNQNTYGFGEQVDKLGLKVLETNIASLDRKNITAWALTDIDTKFGEKIKFSYKNKVTSSKYQKRVDINIIEASPTSASQWEHIVDEEGKSNNYSNFFLKSIKTANESIEFADTQTGNRIKQINIVDSLTNTLIKRIEFYYHDLNFLMHGYSFLDSIKIFDKNLNGFQKYSFTYYEADAGVLVPDQWGYNKIVPTGYSKEVLHTELGNDFARPSGSEYTSNRIVGKVSDSYAGYLGNRAENLNPEIFSLKRVSYPTGGYTIYEYEPHKVGATYLGGIRIKSISRFDGINPFGYPILRLKRWYTYGGGVSGFPLDSRQFRNEYPFFQMDLEKRGVTYSTNYFGDRTDMEDAVYYTQVAETTTSDEGQNGKAVYYYENAYTTAHEEPLSVSINGGFFQYYQYGPSHILRYNHWKKPVLSKKEIYSSTNRVLKKETYHYDHISQSFTGLKVKPFAKIGGVFDEFFPYYYAKISSIYKHRLYTVETGKSLLFSKDETVYTENDSLKVTTGYTYNNLDQVIKETTVNSKGQTVEKSTLYPADTPYDYLSSRLLQANDVNKVLEETVKVDNEIVGQTINQYNELPGEIFVSDRVKRYNTATQLQEDGIIFHRYDAKGNILSLSKANDIVFNYLWSYGSKLPIAEIKGLNYQTIENMLGTTAIQEFSGRVKPTKAEIDSFLAPIRNAINAGTLKDIEVSSFSHDPLLGIKSQTDSRGKSTYYEYDAFGRLSLLKDDNGAITRKIDYNYRNH